MTDAVLDGARVPRAVPIPLRERATLALLRPLTLLPPLAARAHRRIGPLHVRAGRGAEAVASFETAPARGITASADVHHQLGQARLAAGKPGTAAVHFRAAIAADPPPVLPSAPVLACSPQAMPARFAALRKVVERFPEHADFTFVLSRLLSALGDYAQARRALDTLRLRQRQNAGPDLAPDPAGPRPAFLTIGQGKAGTTSLAAYFCQHPRVQPAITKEVGYWSDFPAAGLDWYPLDFPPIPAGSGLVTGDASPQYLVDTAIPAQVARDCPDAKLIALLRDPIARAYSACSMFQRLGRETRRWEDVVDAELAGLPVCPLRLRDIPLEFDPRLPGSFLLRSAVLPFLRCWLAHFPPERFLILKHEDLRRDTTATARRVFRFPDLPDFMADCADRRNVSHYVPMWPQTRRRLEDRFAPHQRALSALLTDLGMALSCLGG